MRVLLDTNIVIHRENKKMTNYSIGHLYRWIDKLHYEKVIHPYSIKEIQRYVYSDPQESMVLKLEAYNILKTVLEPEASFLALLDDLAKSDNDRIDNCLLYEVYQGRVDLLITEDRRMRYKAAKLGINDKVYSINSFISFVTSEYPELIDYKMLAVKKTLFGQVDLSNPFFNSFRESYDGFDKWFIKKCDEEAYICHNDFGDTLGFLYLKTEEKDENYADITPVFEKKRRLKVGTFKVESTGFRLGERFIKIIFDNAQARNVDEIYITLFTGREELKALYDVLKRWGFCEYGNKTTNGKIEIVLTKEMKKYNLALSAKQNYPNLEYNKQKFILPIISKYHTTLLPDSILNNENEVDFLGGEPHRYALQKVYISWAFERKINSGDLVFFYRMGNAGTIKKYSSVLTTLCIVDELRYNFRNREEFFKSCQNRSVFTAEELNEFWEKHRDSLTVLKFIYVTSLFKRLTLEYLWSKDIIEPPNGPRPFTRLSDTQFDNILKDSLTDLSKYWRA